MASADSIVRVGLIKAVPRKWDLAANWETFDQLAASAKKRGAQIVCSPECFLDGYVVTDYTGFTPERFLAIGQSPESGGYLLKARELALKYRIHIVLGFTELVDRGCYNTAAIIDDQGELLGRYHKTHLLGHDRRYLPGDDLPVWQTSLGRIAIMICADRRWPEVARALKTRGAELILNPSYGMWHLDNEWWMRTRSYENEIFICFVHPNVALITDPQGAVSAKLQSNIPDVLVHDVDLSSIPDEMFSARRQGLYVVS